MPAPRDLTGLRFGSLTVLRSDGRVKFGQVMTAWLCRCDCGAEVRVPQRRLTTGQESQQMRACEDCRAVPCEICGKPVLLAAKSKTCSAECRAERERRYQLAYYHDVRTADPEDTARRRARAREAWATLSPEEKLAARRARAESEDRDRVNARDRDSYHRRMQDPEYAARLREMRQEWAAENPEKMRGYTRKSARKRRATAAELDMLRVIDRLKGEDE